MKIEIFCPICAKQGYKRKLMEAEQPAVQVILYPYCKACKKNVKIVLSGKIAV